MSVTLEGASPLYTFIWILGKLSQKQTEDATRGCGGKERGLGLGKRDQGRQEESRRMLWDNRLAQW